MQGFQEETIAAVFNRRDVLLAAQRNLSDADFPGRAQRLTHDSICVLCKFISGHQVVWLVEIQRRDIAGADKLHQLERFL